MLSSYFKPLSIIKEGVSIFDGTPDPDSTTSIASEGLIQPLGKKEEFRGQTGELADHRLFAPVVFEGEQGDRIEQGGKEFILITNNDVDGVTGIKKHHQELLLRRFISNG